MKIDDHPVRPPPPATSTLSCGGRGGRDAAEEKGVWREQSSSFLGCPVCAPRALVQVFPVEGDDELHASDEQEGADVPPSLPNPYQPTRSEYLDFQVIPERL